MWYYENTKRNAKGEVSLFDGRLKARGEDAPKAAEGKQGNASSVSHQRLPSNGTATHSPYPARQGGAVTLPPRRGAEAT